MRRLFTGLMVAIAVTAAANAAPSLEFSIGLCAAKTDATERLACYDALAAKLRAGEIAAAAPAAPAAAPLAPAPVAAAPVTTAPAAAAPIAPPPVAAPVQQLPESQFGAENLKKESRAAAGQPEPLDEIHSVVKQLAFAPNGRVIVTLENGQVWRQIDGDTDRFRGKVGEAATIERAFLGSYSLSIDGHNQIVKVQRVR